MRLNHFYELLSLGVGDCHSEQEEAHQQLWENSLERNTAVTCSWDWQVEFSSLKTEPVDQLCVDPARTPNLLRLRLAFAESASLWGSVAIHSPYFQELGEAALNGANERTSRSLGHELR